ncbi:MAG: BPL-N domain-containing protein [Thermodesulfovibrionales bacterium]
MKTSSNPEKSTTSKVAFLWDESFLWGVMSYKALRANGLSFDLFRSEDIRRGKLKDYSLLFVAGGWASNKLKSLGDDGVSEIKKFVRRGGNYLGFCGGAGLATLDGMGLVNVRRKPTKERVPSFSGRIRLDLIEHPIWKAIREGGPKGGGNSSSQIFQAWWPSQFLVEGEETKILATYRDALPDSFSADLNVGDTEAAGSWDKMEKIYGIKLDPDRLRNDPAVLEGKYGEGRVILSLIHFDTPGDENGPVVLGNLWEYLAGEKSERRECGNHPQNAAGLSEPAVYVDLMKAVHEFEAEVGELISLGMRNFLWFWRNPMLLQWRRGVRGLEYCTLYIMIREIAEIMRIKKAPWAGDVTSRLERGLGVARSLLNPFIKDAKRLIIMERFALQNGHITYDRCEDPEIKKIRMELFSHSKSYGGLFKDVINEIDRVLFMLICPAANK